MPRENDDGDSREDHSGDRNPSADRPPGDVPVARIGCGDSVEDETSEQQETEAVEQRPPTDDRAADAHDPGKP